ncbi:hypothetical protein BDU57DRAFT_256354 [Ampelomyces quisqualis]|uniref:Uncharacterized protein n=1 Tax=Ampelomyces quisqualis TaxID=50730 RepID=A0A6A5QP31_AMPQU|nr:hypothetical protein BDU57DRAFT_256354 [Ampelomyces quisqualis]
MADSTILGVGDSNDGHTIHVKSQTANKITPPRSESSGDTQREDMSSDIRSNADGAQLISSPISPESLDFKNLTIDDNIPRAPKGSVERYTAPFQRGIKNYNESSRFNYHSVNVPRREDGFRTKSSYSSRDGGGNYRSSHTWMSSDAQAMQEFMVIRNAMRRQFKHSDVSKWKVADYVAHREAMVASQATKLANKVKAKEDALSLRIPEITPEIQQNLNKWGLFGNFAQQGNLSRVLGEQTIWCHDWLDGKEEVAPWPSLAEYKWEGDDRAKTGVGRFLPLAREEGPPGLPWNQLPCVEQFPMDQVARIPTMEDIYLPVDDQIEEEMEYLWSKELEEAMDAFLETW